MRWVRGLFVILRFEWLEIEIIMQQYWINFKGKQDGPFTIDALRDKGLDESAYVWFRGLDDWVKISSVPELASLLDEPPTVDDAAESEEPVNVIDAALAEAKAQTVAELDGEESPVEYEMPAVPLDSETTLSPDEADRLAPPMPSPRMAVEAPAATAKGKKQPSDAPKCPPSNLVWAIISTVVCCIPVGAVAIILSFKVRKAYRRGDYELAQKWSDRVAWIVIAAIIAGILSYPLRKLVF